jgi:hypothetical protein
MAGAPKGNTNSARGKAFTDALKRMIARRGEGDAIPYEGGLNKLAEVLVEEAIDNRQAWAMQEIANRLDGKPAQSVELTGDEDRPLTMGIVRLVRPG